MRHATRRLVLVLLVFLLPRLAPAAEGIGAEPHYNGWDLEREFDDIKRKIKDLPDLRRKDRIAARRLGDIEANVRDIRASIHALDLRLRSIESTLTDVQASLVSLSKKAPAGTEPAKTGEGDVPREPEGPLAEILDEQLSRDGTFITITGRVRNLTDRPLTFIAVQATFTDEQGNIVKTQSAYVTPGVLAPGARGAFKITTRHDSRVRRHRLSIQAK